MDFRGDLNALHNRGSQLQSAAIRCRELEAALFHANEVAAEEMAAIARAPALLFYPKYRLGHPEKYVFYYQNLYFQDQSIQK